MKLRLTRLKLTLSMGATVSVMFLGAGCGDSNDRNVAVSGDESATAPLSEITIDSSPMSKARFVRQAGALCRKARVEFQEKIFNFLREVSGNTSRPESVQEVEGVETALVPVYESMMESIAALGAPDRDVDEVEAFFDAIQLDLNETLNEPSRLYRSPTPFDQAPALAEAAGLDGCANSLA